MSIRLTGATRVIAPSTEIPYNYTAEETISRGDVVAKSETTRRILKAQASDSSRMPAIGTARESKVAGQTIEVLQFGIAEDISRDADFGYDDKIFVSTTAGQATATPPQGIGTLVQSLGRSLNASNIILAIDQTYFEIGEE